MDIQAGILFLFAALSGLFLYLLLAILLFTKRSPGVADWIALGAAVSTLVWSAAKAVSQYQGVLLFEDTARLALLESVADIAMLFACVFVLHLALVWAGLRAGWGIALYVAPAFTLAAGIAERTRLADGYAAAALLGAIAVSAWTGWREPASPQRAFHWGVAAALALAGLAAFAAGQESAVFALAILLPGCCLLHFIRRYNILGILIGRRMLFVFTLALVSALYLLLARAISEQIATAFDAWGGLVELSLILAAAILWLPLFEWITRYFSRQTELYLRFAKEIIEKADAILDPADRVQFLAAQTGTLFRLRRLWLITASEPRLAGIHGNGQRDVPELVAALERCVRGSKSELLHVRRTRDPEIRRLLGELGFHYAFGLWHQEALAGVMLVDTSPRVYLDEHESILANLSREISHSIETCRLVEDKIRLEKTLLQQEHLAGLGKVAATIAHEVKNPLSSIKTLAQLMAEDPRIRESYGRDVGFIVAETDRLASCVQQLLVFSRPAAEPHPEVPVQDLLEMTAGTLQREYGAQGTRILSSVGEGVRGRLVDRQSVQQIVLNLALNAIQAAGPGATIRLSAALDALGRTVIQVTDDGPGVPPEIQDQIFEPFFTTRKKGTGLGLAIVKKNATQLGGCVSLRSPVENGRGAEFRVTLAAPLTSEVRS